MIHFIYKIKGMLREKVLLFWAFIFPVFLGLAFFFMFGNIHNSFKFEQIKIGVVHSEQDENFLKLLEFLETENKEKMFDIKKFQENEDAMKALEEDAISCFIDFEKDLELNVKKSNVSNTIVETIITQYRENTNLIKGIAQKNPEKLEIFLKNFIKNQEIEIRQISLKGQDKNSFTQYFYALLSMTCLIASMGGLQDGMRIQPNLSALGARRNIAPTRKIIQFGTDFLASYLLYCILASLVLVICIFVYKQDFGDNVFLVLVATWIGTFVGLVVGNLIAIMVPGSMQKKDSICVAFFMVSSFLGGLQWGDITYYIEKNCPIINRINPATLIVNSYRSLMVFGDYKEYAKNLITLVGIGLVCITICVMKLRREKYASI